MGKSITAAEAAKRLKVNQARVRALLNDGRIKGARCIGRVWFIPDDFTVIPGTRGPKPKATGK